MMPPLRSEKSATSARSRRWPRFSAARRKPDSRRWLPASVFSSVNCASHEPYLIETLKFGDRNPGFQDLLRAAAAGLGALGLWGRTTAVDALFEVGIPARDPARSPIALALAMIAMRNTALMMPLLEKHPARDEAITLLAEGFDMLEEDFEKERFFSFARRTYWAAPEAAPARDLMQTLIGRLDF